MIVLVKRVCVHPQKQVSIGLLTTVIAVITVTNDIL